MSKSINRATILGHLTKDPILRNTAGGTPSCQLDIATNERFKDKSGEWQEKAEYHRVQLWSRLAEIANEYLRRGSQVYIEGYLQTRSYEDKKTNTTKWTTEIVARELVLCGGKGDTSQAAPQTQQEPAMAGVDDSDVPF